MDSIEFKKDIEVSIEGLENNFLEKDLWKTDVMALSEYMYLKGNFKPRVKLSPIINN